MQADDPVAIPIVEAPLRHFQSASRGDKQLAGVRLKDVLEKRALDQALNAKEFAVLAGISYSTARQWFRSPCFPALRGFVFWTDFVEWRRRYFGAETPTTGSLSHGASPSSASVDILRLPPKARKVLADVSAAAIL